MSKNNKKKKKSKKKSSDKVNVGIKPETNAVIDEAIARNGESVAEKDPNEQKEKRCTWKWFFVNVMLFIAPILALAIVFYFTLWIATGISPFAKVKDYHQRKELRSALGTHLIKGLDENRALNKISPGVYGYQWYQTTASRTFNEHLEEITLCASHYDLETHYLADGDIAIVGYVTKETKNKLELNEPVEFWFFCEMPYHGEITADCLVSVSLKNTTILERNQYSQGLHGSSMLDKYFIRYQKE